MFVNLSLSLPQDHPIFSLANSDGYGPTSHGHVGTHLDTYLQVPIPVDWCERRAVLIDARSHGSVVSETAIDGLDIREGDMVIFRTGRMEETAYTVPEYFMNHPVLDWELIRTLLKKKISFIGIDAAGIRPGKKLGDEHHLADIECEESGCYVIENLTNLESLPDRSRSDFPVRLGWIQHQGASGVPVKVIAVV
ncbi:cyclase family protein [Paraburkholderia sp. JHI869]|uniref:cyclase family protein n=1 Tax=Paraburkholderia sp. JHI869 TaxID=3112959 RepID=UPI003174BD84